MIRKLFFLLLIITLYGCSSVEKYNQRISRLHNPEKLKKDVDYAYKKLQKLHPDIHWYVKKDFLNKEIRELKERIDKPLTSKEFYKEFAPVIMNIKQGHLSLRVPRKRQVRKEKKEKGKRNSPFKDVFFQSTQNKMFIKHTHDIDSSWIGGAEVVRVDSVEVKKLLESFRELQSSDGYNKTFMSGFAGDRFGSFYTNLYHQKDSILLDLKIKDSSFSKFLYATYNDKKNNSKKDSSNTKKVKLSKQERKTIKQSKKKVKKDNYRYGYNKRTKQYYRNFEFLASTDNIPTAYMKINGFSNGGYKRFYKESFAAIDSVGCKNLIIDLRGNLGGRISEIDHLYSYLTDKEYVFLEPSKMTKGSSFLYPYFHSKSIGIKTIAAILSPVLVVYKMVKVKKKKGAAYFKLKYNKLREPKPNAYAGKIYVLIDGESFSASSILSTHLKHTKRAIFVGEETGGAYNGTVAGLFAGIELPTSKIKIHVGLMKINTPYIIDPDGYGIIPDIPIQRTVNKVDEELNWVLKDIQKSNFKD